MLTALCTLFLLVNPPATPPAEPPKIPTTAFVSEAPKDA